MKKVIGIAMVISALTVNSMTALAATEPGWQCPAGVCTEYSQCSGHGTCMGNESCTYQDCPDHGTNSANGCAYTSGQGGHHGGGHRGGQRHAGGHHR